MMLTIQPNTSRYSKALTPKSSGMKPVGNGAPQTPDIRFAGKGGMTLIELLVVAAIVGIGSTVFQKGCSTIKPVTPHVAVANARTIPLSISTNPDWIGKCVDGTLDGQSVQLHVDPTFLGKTITGTFQGQAVNLTFAPILIGKQVTGTFKGMPVNFEISETFVGKSVKGTFQGKHVEMEVSPNWFGKNFKGSFQGTPVDLNINPDFVGKSIEGTFGGGSVELHAVPDWFGKKLEGNVTVPEGSNFSDFVGFLLCNLHILKD